MSTKVQAVRAEIEVPKIDVPKPNVGFLIRTLKSSPFYIAHIVAIVGVFYYPPTWKLVALCLTFYYLRMFSITGGYHRYFSHRSYKTGRVFQFILALLGSMSVQKGVLWWASNHREHHRNSDTDLDIHSPVKKSLWWAHVGWIISPDYEESRHDLIRDFAKYPELRWLDKYHMVTVVLFATAIWLVGGWPALIWGFFFSTLILWHTTFLVNSAAHVWGTRRYNTTDQSRNNLWIALLTMGEGWHNNHHYYMSSTRQGFMWWEIDMTYYILKFLSWFGIVWDMREPPAEKVKNTL